MTKGGSRRAALRFVVLAEMALMRNLRVGRVRSRMVRLGLLGFGFRPDVAGAGDKGQVFEPLGKGGVEGGLVIAAAPVAAGGSGGVHAGFGAEADDVLKRYDGHAGDRSEGHAQEVPVDF